MQEDWIELEESGGFVGVKLRYRLPLLKLDETKRQLLLTNVSSSEPLNSSSSASLAPSRQSIHQKLFLQTGEQRFEINQQNIDPDQFEELTAYLRQYPVRR